MRRGEQIFLSQNGKTIGLIALEKSPHILWVFSRKTEKGHCAITSAPMLLDDASPIVAAWRKKGYRLQDQPPPELQAFLEKRKVA
jgi:hypothetical protein